MIAERVGWTGSITWFRENVRGLRVEHRPVDPSDRLTWLPGDAAQCDLWFPPKKIPLEDGTKTLLPVMVITAAHSRFMLGQMIPTRHTVVPAVGLPRPDHGPAVAVWGLVNGVLDSTLKAAVSELVDRDSRAVAFGWLAFVRGLGLLASGAVLGVAYDHSIGLVVGLVIGANAVALAGLVTVLPGARKPPARH